jgi:hypothetical protein
VLALPEGGFFIELGGGTQFPFFLGAFSYQFEEETMKLLMSISLSARTKLRLLQRVVFRDISYLEIVLNLPVSHTKINAGLSSLHFTMRIEKIFFFR